MADESEDIDGFKKTRSERTLREEDHGKDRIPRIATDESLPIFVKKLMHTEEMPNTGTIKTIDFVYRSMERYPLRSMRGGGGGQRKGSKTTIKGEGQRKGLKRNECQRNGSKTTIKERNQRGRSVKERNLRQRDELEAHRTV